MKSSPKRIIRGADVEGIMFCSPSGNLKKNHPEKEQKENDLKALEEFWYQKGLKEGKEKGYQEGLKEGKTLGKKEGFEEGKKEGLEEGKDLGKNSIKEEAFKEAAEEFQNSLQLVQSFTKNLQVERENILDKNRGEIIELCISISEKVLSKELSNKQHLIQTIGNVLSKAKSISHNEAVHIFLSEGDYEKFKGQIEKIHFDHIKSKSLDFASDINVKVNNFRIESSLGILNFDIKRQLELIENDLIQAHND